MDDHQPLFMNKAEMHAAPPQVVERESAPARGAATGGPAPAPNFLRTIVGEDMRLAMFWRRLFDAGLFTNPAVAPAVEPGRALLRTSCIATHTAEHVDRALDVVATVGEKLHVVPQRV